MKKWQEILLSILGWILLALFITLCVFAGIKSNRDYKAYLVEYENAEDEITYRVYEYEQLTNHKGFTIYKTIIDGETYYTQTVEYKIGGGDGFYLVLTKKEKSSYMQYFFYGIATGSKTRDVYSYKLLVVY